MGFLDSIKERLQLGGNDEYYYDDEEGYYDEYDEPQPSSSGLLGQTSRPEAPSMSVYSHSTGRPVGETATRSAANQRSASNGRSGYGRTSNAYDGSYTPAPSAVSSTSSTSYTPVATNLPPYVLKPTVYDDVQSVIRRVKTGQPVVIAFGNCKVETARRILDFCFGLSCGIDGKVEELGDRAFVVLPAGASVSESDIDKLVADGVFSRR